MTAQGGSSIWGEPEAIHESAVGLREMRQGVVLCKRVALMSPLPERRGNSWDIQDLGND